MTTTLPTGSERPTTEDPVAAAVRLRPPHRQGMSEHFAPTDPAPGWEVTRFSAVRRLVRHRRFQFALILPNQIIFWLVIISGLAGTVVPGLNFGTAITWYLWFCLVFVMMVVAGRAWCAMCPFGGFAEWLQRRSLWQRTQKALGLGRKVPEPIARYGFVLSVGTFLLLTFIEEFFNIAGPGAPYATSWMVVGIVASAVTFFLVFERRSFCRYFCPLTALIGTVGAMGSAAGFRTKDRERCVSCATKDCMRGGSEGYGCPWYTWPASADANLSCGLCSECYKACPTGNVGLFVQRPFTSVIAPARRRADIAWAVVLLWGLVVYQQVNATNGYASLDNWLNEHLHFPHYPDPVAYLGIIVLVALATAGAVRLIGRTTGGRLARTARPGAHFLERTSRFRSFFLPMAYGLIPVVGADYFARQLPKFLEFVPRLIPAVGHPFGLGSTQSRLYHASLLTGTGIVVVQVAVMALGTLGAMWAMWRISGRDLAPMAVHPLAARLSAVGLAAVCGAVAASLYVIMHAAT